MTQRQRPTLQTIANAPALPFLLAAICAFLGAAAMAVVLFLANIAAGVL